jgi:hypothetical protein
MASVQLLKLYRVIISKANMLCTTRPETRRPRFNLTQNYVGMSEIQSNSPLHPHLHPLPTPHPSLTFLHLPM